MDRLDFLSAAELGNLRDPFFKIVLRKNADVVSLSGIEDLIQPDKSRRQVFVVSESLADTRSGQMRRSVITFTGRNADTRDFLRGNVMISVFFSSEEFPDQPQAIEVMSWDAHLGQYNYYKMDDSGTPDQIKSWKFRGSSKDADRMLAHERTGTCMQCHVNGGPIMKELAVPWNNWHSDIFQASYMQNNWRVKDNPRIKKPIRGCRCIRNSVYSWSNKTI